jgi:hypothetical protein
MKKVHYANFMQAQRIVEMVVAPTVMPLLNVANTQNSLAKPAL